MGVGKSKQFPISYEDACKRGEGLSVSKRVHVWPLLLFNIIDQRARSD